MQHSRVAFVVDDDRSVREPICHTLEEYGYKVVEVESGDKLLSILPLHSPDIIFLDIYMGGTDGIECCKKIRRLPRFEKTPIVIISVEDAKEIVHKALDAGANDYILKDISIIERLKDVVNKYGKITPQADDGNSQYNNKAPLTSQPQAVATNTTNTQNHEKHSNTSATTNSRSILVVDDEPSLLDMISLFLIENGFAVSKAKDGGEGRELLRKNRYDVILLDIQMPSVNGFELLTWLRKEGIKTPVILMSSRATYATLESSIKFGAVTLIDKPINLERLLEDVKSALSNKPIVKRNRRLLIADDHGYTRESLSIFLQEAGYFVTAVVDGNEAIDAAKSTSQPFDIAIIDIMMPKMHGEQVVAELKKISPRTLPILITGEATSDEIREGYKEGAFSLIRKPIDFGLLLNALASYERECDERQKEIAKEEEYKHLPFYTKTYLWAKSYIDAPPNSPKNLKIRTALIILLSIVTGVALFFAISEFGGCVKEFKERTDRGLEAIERATENTEWDRERKERIDRGEFRKPR